MRVKKTLEILRSYSPEAPRKPAAGAAYFKSKHLELVEFLDRVWADLPGEVKDRVFALVDDLDRSWLSEDREGFDRIITEIRETANPVFDMEIDPPPEPEQTAIFLTRETRGGDPA